MSDGESLLPPHGGYRGLKAYQNAVIVYDATVAFCARFFRPTNRIVEQMVHAARSGKQNIAEGSSASGTSKTTDLKLIGVARASLEELLVDYEDFLRQREFTQWEKDNPKAIYVRNLAYKPNRSYQTYKNYIEDKTPETAANTMICLLRQTNYLLDQLKRQLGESLLQEGGMSEKIYRERRLRRGF